MVASGARILSSVSHLPSVSSPYGHLPINTPCGPIHAISSNTFFHISIIYLHESKPFLFMSLLHMAIFSCNRFYYHEIQLFLLTMTRNYLHPKGFRKLNAQGQGSYQVQHRWINFSVRLPPKSKCCFKDLNPELSSHIVTLLLSKTRHLHDDPICTLICIVMCVL